jgi:hypothetical protein
VNQFQPGHDGTVLIWAVPVLTAELLFFFFFVRTFESHVPKAHAATMQIKVKTLTGKMIEIVR